MGRKKINKNKSKTISQRAIRTYISITTWNVNGLNAPTKDRLAEWIEKQEPYIYIYIYIYAAFRRPTSVLGTHTKWKWEDRKKKFNGNRNQKKAEVEILISDKIDLKIKL